MPKTKNPQEIILKTTHLSPRGRGATSDNKMEVIGALPSEEVLVVLGPKRKKKRIGFLKEVLKPSADRVPLKCRHAPDCGGCSIQAMSYKAQLNHKQQELEKLFGDEVRPIIECDSPWQYRNKMEFSFSQNKEGEKFLGLMLAGRSGKVFHLKECHLVSEWFSKTLCAVRDWWEKSSLKAYHFRSDEGHLRTLTLREAKQGKGKMVMMTVSGNTAFAIKKDQLESFKSAVKKVYPEDDLSIFLQIQQIAKGRPTQFFEMLLSGPDHITEKLHIDLHSQVQSLEFKISPTSFFQPNTLQAQKLYAIGLGLLSNLKGKRLFDLYCGGATIGLSAARFAGEVVGIELNHHSVFDANWNKEVNGIENFSIHRGDVAKVLEELRKNPKFTAPDVVIVDPPRLGLGEKSIAHLISLGPKEILYISCNPKTQALDIEPLKEAGYQIKVIQPIDQFPHTVHVENIVLLEYAEAESVKARL